MLAVYSALRRARDKLAGIAFRRSFGSCGQRTVINLPCRIVGPAGIHLGHGVKIGPSSFLEANGGRIEIGDGTTSTGLTQITAANLVRVGSRCLLARNVFISDHGHAFGDHVLPVRDQGITEPRAVVVEDGAWLGTNVVVTPGVTIGRNAVIGANSVVLADVPAFSVAVGAPARIVGHVPV